MFTSNGYRMLVVSNRYPLLGEQIKAARVAKGFSREELAVAVGKSWPTIRSYEHGKATPPLDVLGALADVLDVTVSSLLENVLIEFR